METSVRILIAEQDAAYLGLMEQELKKNNIDYQAAIVATEAEYTNTLTNFCPHIILFGSTISSFDAHTAFDIKENLAQGLPFIFVTENTDEERAVELVKKGVTDYVFKGSLLILPVKVRRALKEARQQQEKDKIEKELIKSKLRLRELQTVSKTGSWETDLSTREVTWSEETFRIFEKDPATFKTSHSAFLELIHPEDRLRVDTAFVNSLTTDLINSIEHRIVTPGGIKIVEESWQVVFNQQKQPARVVGTCRDISNLKKAENQIKDSEERYRTLFEHNLTGIYQASLNGTVLNCNDAFVKMLKYDSKQQLQEAGASGLYFSSAEQMNFSKEIREKERLNNYERVLKCKDGTELYTLENITLRKNEVTGETLLEGIVIDMTERKKAEATLLKHGSQLSLSAEMAKLGYWEYDVLNDIFYFNDQFYAIFKTTAQTVGGYTMSSARYAELFVHPEDREIVGRSVADAIGSKDATFSFKAEHRILYDSGETGYISVHFFIVKDEQGRTVKNYGVNQDITGHKLSQLRLNEMNINLKQQAKQLELSNTELEQFAYVASHDLQEPLRMVNGFLTLLQKKYKNALDEKGNEYIFHAVNGANRMKDLISDILEFSRAGRTENMLEPVNVEEVVEDVKLLLNTKVGHHNASFQTSSLPVIKAYKSSVTRVLQNLISNALKYRDLHKPACIQIDSTELENHWQFSVADNGIGIKEEHFKKIFSIFQRLHSNTRYSGTGIGLAITKKEVINMGGDIWVTSKPEEGSTFYFTIAKKLPVN